MKQKIAIIGAGMLGMALALRLTEAGYQVSIFEKDDDVGGLVSSTRIGDFSWDKFYHVISLTDTHTIDLLRTLKLESQIHWNETKTGFFTDGELYSMSTTLEFLSFPPLTLWNKMRLGFTILYASHIKSGHKLENILVSDWLKRLSGKKTFEKIWLPLLKSKLGDNYKNTNAAFIWAIIARMYAARRSELKMERFGYIAEGYAAILNEMKKYLQQLNVDILCNHSVIKIIDRKKFVEVHSTNGNSLEFDRVVLTIPCSEIVHVCPQLSAHERQRLRDIQYQGVICGMLLVKNPLAGYYITNITDSNIPFTAVIEMTALVDSAQFGGKTLVYLPRYVAQNDPYWEKDEVVIHDDFIAALKKIYPEFKKNEIMSFNVLKAKNVLPITTLNYSQVLLPGTQTSLENILIVNSSQVANGTMNVNEIIALANRKAVELLIHP